MRTELTRQTFPDQIAESLTDHIIVEGLKPGDLLPSTAKLAQDFGVSIPVIREALKSLAGQGIIEIINGKGAVIKPLDNESLQIFFQRAIQFELDSIIEIMEIRQPLEVQSAFLAAQRRTDEDVAALQKTIAAMRGQVHQVETYADLDVQLHKQIAAATQNKMMVHLIASVRDSLRDAILESLRRRNIKKELERVQDIHERIIDEIAQGDAERAAKAMAEHFNDAVNAFVSMFDNES